MTKTNWSKKMSNKDNNAVEAARQAACIRFWDDFGVKGYKVSDMMVKQLFDAGLQASQQWVAVSERLPEGLARLCWVTIDDDTVDAPTTFSAFWNGEGFATGDPYQADIGSVSAWQEYFTPAPYTGETE